MSSMDTEPVAPSPHAAMTGVLKNVPTMQAGSHVIVPAVKPYPPTKEITMHLPAAAKQLMGGEQTVPQDYIPSDLQAQFIPILNATIAVPRTEAEQEELTEKNETLPAREMMCKQVPLTPESIEAIIDMERGQIVVSAKFTNPTDACGEANVSVAQLTDFTCVCMQETVADYPFKSWVRTNDDAQRHYTETNRSATKGSSVSSSTRGLKARKFKVPANDPFTVTCTFQENDQEAHWREMPYSPAAEGQPPAFPKRAREVAFFTPPGDGKVAVPLRIKVCRLRDDGLSFALPTSQAVEQEAKARELTMGAGVGVYYMHTDDQQETNDDGWEVVPAKCAPAERGEMQLAADFKLSAAPYEPVCLKLRLVDERPRHEDLGVEQLATQMGSMQVEQGQAVVNVLAHARTACPLLGKAGNPLGNGVAVCEVILPDSMPAGGEAMRDPTIINGLFIIDASGSMYSYCPHTAKMSNLGKIELEVEQICGKLLRLPAFLRAKGLAIEGDRILITIARFHSHCTVIASDIDLTSVGAEEEVQRAVADFKACRDSGGTTYSSWLPPLEAMLKKPGEHFVFVGTDGGAYDQREFFSKLDRIKAEMPKMKVMVVAMGRYLDEECARKTQNAGHRLMQDVGPGFTDLGYQLIFKACVRLLQSLTLNVSARVLTLQDYSGAMPSTTHDDAAVAGVGASLQVDMGTRLVVTVPVTYLGLAFTELELPEFKLGGNAAHRRVGIAAKTQSSVIHLPADAIATLKYLDTFYCSSSLRFVGDAKEVHAKAVEGIGLHYSKDTSRTMTGADFEYPSAKGSLKPLVKATMISDPLREGLVREHTEALLPWTAKPGVVRLPQQESSANHDGHDPEVCVCEPGFRSLGADDDDDAPVFRSAAPAPTAAQMAARPSAEIKPKIVGIPSAEAFLVQHGYQYRHSYTTGVLMKVVQQLDMHEEQLLPKCDSAKMHARYDLRSRGNKMDDVSLEEMADEQGDGEAGAMAYLEGVAAELRSMVGVLAHMAFLYRAPTGVDICNLPFGSPLFGGPGDPLVADMVLLRARYLRQVAACLASLPQVGQPQHYRAVVTFDEFVEHATATHSAFTTSLKWVEAPQLLDSKGNKFLASDRPVGSLSDAVQDACTKLAKAWAQHVGMAGGGVFPSDAVVRSLGKPKGFTAQKLLIPHYCNHAGHEAGTDTYRPWGMRWGVPFHKDARFFEDLPEEIAAKMMQCPRTTA